MNFTQILDSFVILGHLGRELYSNSVDYPINSVDYIDVRKFRIDIYFMILILKFCLDQITSPNLTEKSYFRGKTFILL